MDRWNGVLGKGGVIGSIALAAGALGCSSVGDATEPGGAETLGSTRQALTNLGVSRRIPVRFIALGQKQSDADRPSNSDMRAALDWANQVYRGAGVQLDLAPIERYVVDSKYVKDEDTKFAQSDFRPFLSALGFPSSWSGTCGSGKCNINTWLVDLTADFYGSDEMIAWSGLWGGGNSNTDSLSPTYVRLGKGIAGDHVSHELGHNFGLPHTQEDGTLSCRFWDLVYFADAGGKNRFFGSRAECDAQIESAGSSEWLKLIDPRDRIGICSFWKTIVLPKGSVQALDDDRSDADQSSNPISPATLSADRKFTSKSDCTSFFADKSSDAKVDLRWRISDLEGDVPSRSIDDDGRISIRVPCRDCAEPLEYTAGDWEIRGYARAMGAGSSREYFANVMTYYSAASGGFISDSQVEVVREHLRVNGNGSTPGRGDRVFHGRAVVDNPFYLYDFDGDGLRDIPTWEAPDQECNSPSDCPRGTFRVLKSSEGFAVQDANRRLTRSFGIRGDIPVLADYDGDGLTDLAVFRAGELREYTGSGPDDRAYWLYCASSLDYDCTRPAIKRFGLRGDIPIPRTNFDGGWDEGEAAVYRPSESSFYFGPMCKPSASSGATNCSTSWRGPFRLGGADAHLLVDLWDDDNRSDFAVYNPHSATVQVRLSQSDYADRISFELGGDRIAALSGSDAERAGGVVVPEYERRNGKLRRRFALFDRGTGDWISVPTPADPATAAAVRACSGLGKDDVPIGGIDYTGDDLSDRFVYRGIDLDNRRLVRFRGIGTRSTRIPIVDPGPLIPIPGIPLPNPGDPPFPVLIGRTPNIATAGPLPPGELVPVLPGLSGSLIDQLRGEPLSCSVLGSSTGELNLTSSDESYAVHQIVAPVADMTGDGVADILVIDPYSQMVRIIDAANLSVFATKAIGGPRMFFL